MDFTRREFLKISALAGAATMIPWRWALGSMALPPGTIDPASIPKYVTPLTIPPAMPRVARLSRRGERFDYYEIAARQIVQQILPSGYGPATVFAYGSPRNPQSFHSPAFTIEAQQGKPVWVEWVNQLVDGRRNFLPHILPVDQTLHWANPPGGIAYRDMEKNTDPAPYMGPVPIITHVHGALTTEDSDGFPQAWFLPKAKGIPPGYATEGTNYGDFKALFFARWRKRWQPGSATFRYPNAQRPTTLWYHDHALGITRLNVYAGLAGFYLLRGGADDLAPGILPGPAPSRHDQPGTEYFEIPIVVQDRTFRNDGTLFYPDNRAFFEGVEPSDLRIPFTPAPGCDGGMSDVPAIWNPEFFGNSIVVNGSTWPYLAVRPRRYRFRLLNGCNTRFLILKLVTGDPKQRPASAALPFWMIGQDAGFAAAPVPLPQLLMSPAERFDTIVDFSGFPPGTEVFMVNEGPDEPFGGGVAGTDFPFANPEGAGQIMKFVVTESIGQDTSLPPDQIALPPLPVAPPPEFVRKVSLNERASRNVRVITEGPPGDQDIVMSCDDPEAEPFTPVEAMLGVIAADGTDVPLDWHNPTTETPMPNMTETWELHNFTEDAHPIHLHATHFQVVNRESREDGSIRPPEIWENGFKETVIAYPGEITRINARFSTEGLFVWHCHILEHEDNEMMRPLQVGASVTSPMPMRKPEEA